MQSSNQPGKISVPFANSGEKQPIPVASQVGIEDGRASYTDGFPPLTRTPLSAGGKPPFGTDMNGILNAATVIQQWQSAGGGFKYDSTFATAIGGYPAGAMLVRSDNSGIWVNTVDNNSTDPETFGAGWQPEGAGISTVSMSNANVTLTALQAARPIIIITGTLTANLQLIFPVYQRQWLVVNNATGAFSVTCKTSAGSGVSIATGLSQSIYGDGVNIGSASAAQVQQSVVGAASNLKVSTTGTSAPITITADELILEASAGIYLTVRSVNLASVTLAGSGANGLDSGTSAASTWYSLWVISNGTTTSGLLSLSETSPTMPSGYTFKARVGWVRSDNTANKYPLGIVQAGNIVRYRVLAGSNVPSVPLMISGQLGDPLGNSPTYIPVAIAGFVPPTAVIATVTLSGYVANSSAIAAPNPNYQGISSVNSIAAPLSVSLQAASPTHMAATGNFLIESGNFYYAASALPAGLSCNGWEDNL